MKRHLRLAAVICALLAAAPVLAQSSDDASADLPKPPARSERLDVYGAGMCHTCEWRPHAKVMSAGDQCGNAADGKANVAVFECGRSPSCDPVCNFVRCGTE
ncbi:MAG: hypothetical protein U1F52_16110 [Burkholderiales bacterium]